MKNRVQTRTEKTALSFTVALFSETGERHYYLTDQSVASRLKMIDVLRTHFEQGTISIIERQSLQEAYLRLIDPDKSG